MLARGFSTPGGIAVDHATSEVSVDANNSVLDIFSVAGACVGQFLLPAAFEAVNTRSVAADDANGRVYAADSGPEVIVYVCDAEKREFESTWTGPTPPSVVATAMVTEIVQLDSLFQGPAIRLSDARLAEFVRGHGARL